MSSRLSILVLAPLVALVACGDDPATKDDADVAEAPWRPSVARALPHLPATFTAHAHGDHIVLRTGDGLWRSTDGGRTFASWTPLGSLDVVPLADGRAIQIRNARTSEDPELVLEDVAPPGNLRPVAVAPDFGAGGVWVGGALTVGAPGTGHVWLQAFGRVGEDTLAPTRLFLVDTSTLPTTGTNAVTAVALPDGAPAGSVWTLAELTDGRLAASVWDGDGVRVWLRDVDGTWSLPATSTELVALVATDDGALVGARVLDGAASLVRLVPTSSGAALPTFDETVTPTTAVFGLTRGADGALFGVSQFAIQPFSEAGTMVVRSDDGGRTWQTLATGLTPSPRFDARVAVASTGLWSSDGPFPVWRPHTGGPWRLAGMSSAVSIPFLQIDGDELWAVTFRAPLPGVRDAGYHLLRSTDRGRAWQHAAELGVAVTCFATASEFLFFGGVGDVRGAGWETRDRTGRTLIRNERMKLEGDPATAALSMIACANGGGRSVVVSVAEDGKRPSHLFDVNLQHQWVPTASTPWSRWSLRDDIRITALEAGPPNITPLLAAAEDLFQMAFGFESVAQTAFYDTSASGFVFTTDLLFDQVGSRGAVRLHGDVYVYPDGTFHRGWVRPEAVDGLEDRTVVLDALDDAADDLWLGTTSGLYRTGEAPDPFGPPPDPVEGACVVDADCPGFRGGNLCLAQDRCVDGTCQHRPLNTCAGVPAPAPCQLMVCAPATGACAPETAPDFTACGRVDACHAPSTCHGGVCQDGAPLTCEGATDCMEVSCDPSRGCVNAFVPAGALCGVDDDDACVASGRCSGEGAGCVGGGGARDCDDGDACTADACEAASGCAHAPLDTPECQDRPDPCADVTCADDHNPCTSDACVPGRGCVYPPSEDGSACGFGDACRSDGYCQMGWCVGGEAQPDGTSCTSGDPCVEGEVCFGGACGGGVALADGAQCDDGLACTSGDTCERGACVGALDGPACPGLAACPDCDAPAGPALVVAYAGGTGPGLLVLSSRGALIDVIPTPDIGGFGVEHDHATGDGLWVTNSRSLSKVGWDGEVVGELAIGFNAVGQTAVGGLDHVLAPTGAGDVFVVKAGSSTKALHMIDAATGALVMSSQTVGQLNAVAVDTIVPRDGFPRGAPSYWTGAQGGLVHVALGAIDAEVAPLPPLDGTARGIALDPESGDLWIVAVQFDSQVSLVRTSGQVVRTFEIVWPPGLDPDSDAFDLTRWPGRGAFPKP
ncbi:MAG: hypothetical protein IT385_02805 [Deltaproteobacteria bacterium]|nr:hypothetical protein [Deltaproteobacteria bacterium]